MKLSQEVIRIDYYFDSAIAKVTVESVTLWMALAAITGLMTYTLYRHRKISAPTAILLPILVFYLSFVLTITVFERATSRRAQYELELFWSYRVAAKRRPELLWENFWNVLLFVPIGAMTASILRKRPWLGAVLGVLLSVGIELTQLWLHRGLFEFDDIFHNTVGAVIGVGVYLLVIRSLQYDGPAQSVDEPKGRKGSDSVEGGGER